MAYEKIGDVKIYYELKHQGEGKETIVFLNGVMASVSSWRAYQKMFTDRGFQVLLHDFKGQMLSEKPDGPYRFIEHAEETIELLKRLNVHKAHFIGTSYGGEVGMKIASHFPENVQSLTIINSVSEIDEGLRLFVEGWKNEAKRKHGESFFWTMAPTIYHSEYLTREKETLVKRGKAMNKLEEEYFDGQIHLYDTFLNDVNMTDELWKIEAPTLIIAGEEDRLKPRKFSALMAEKIPHAEYLILPKSGHVSIFEKENELKSLLLGFVLKHGEH